MKAIILLFALISTTSVFAMPEGHYAKYCNYNYIKGKLVSRTRGKVVRYCIKRSNNVNYYETSIRTKCDPAFVASVWKFSTVDGLDTKACIRRSRLTSVYLAANAEECAPGYYVDQRGIRRPGYYDSQRCIKF